MSQVIALRPPVENSNGSAWLLEGLLPRNQVVLLDGYAAVGKTALLALLSQRITEQNKKRTVLYLSSKRQVQSRDLFLQKQRANFGQLHAMTFDYEAQPLQSRMVYQMLLECIEEGLIQQKPHCLMIDGLDELLSEAPSADAKLSRLFWSTLHQLAERFQCTILITRSQGFHECRAYGHFTRIGSDLCPFALAMHYHPKAVAQRVVTIIRHKLGPIGKQFHMNFTSDRAELHEKAASENVRPAKTPPHDVPMKPAKNQAKPVSEAEEPIEPKAIATPATITPAPNYENRAHENPIKAPKTMEARAVLGTSA